MEIEANYEEEHEITCPHCGKTSKHMIKGSTTVDLEPPDRDGPDR